MRITNHTLDALSETDHFVRLMAVASGTADIINVVRAYLAGWSRERILRLQKTDAGWAPFDEYQQPFPISSVDDLRQLGDSVRIRCREVNASDVRIAPDLLELDMLFFFANQSVSVHQPSHAQRPERIAPPQHYGLCQFSRGRGQELRI